MYEKKPFGWNEISESFQPLTLDADVNPAQMQYRLKDRDNVVAAMNAVDQYRGAGPEPRANEFAAAIKNFQGKNDLTPDGIMLREGPTLARLNQLLQEKLPKPEAPPRRVAAAPEPHDPMALGRNLKAALDDQERQGLPRVLSSQPRRVAFEPGQGWVTKPGFISTTQPPGTLPPPTARETADLTRAFRQIADANAEKQANDQVAQQPRPQGQQVPQPQRSPTGNQRGLDQERQEARRRYAEELGRLQRPAERGEPAGFEAVPDADLRRLFPGAEGERLVRQRNAAREEFEDRRFLGSATPEQVRERVGQLQREIDRATADSRVTLRISAQDREDLIRLVMTEAGDQSREGREAVVHVILNRLALGFGGQRTVRGIIDAPGQFDGVRVHSRQPAGQRPSIAHVPREFDGTRLGAEEAVDRVLSGQAADPTRGATFFVNPRQVQNPAASPGHNNPRGPLVRIEGHQFYDSFRSGPVQATPPIRIVAPNGRTFDLPRVTTTDPRGARDAVERLNRFLARRDRMFGPGGATR